MHSDQHKFDSSVNDSRRDFNRSGQNVDRNITRSGLTSTYSSQRYGLSNSRFDSSYTSGASRYSSRIIGSGRIFVSARSRFNVDYGPWHNLPEDVLLNIFQRLSFRDLLSASLVCKHWNAVASGDYLWKKYFQLHFHQDTSIPLSPRATRGWRGEFERLVSETPVMHCQTLRDHRAFVLHVCFSNDGELFVTCSHDAKVMVWSSAHPCQLVHQADLQRKYNWMFACYAQFNSSDTLLMVSGAYFGSGPFLTAGEVVVFDLEDDFRLLSRTKNRPYDLFGAWITDDYLVTGELKWLQNMHSLSTLLLIRSTQEVRSEHVPILCTLLKVFNSSSACARCLMVAHCPEDGPPPEKAVLVASRNPTYWPEDENGCIVYSHEYYDAVNAKNAEGTEWPEKRSLTPQRSLDDEEERLLIFTTGSLTYTAHQIGIVRLTPSMPDRIEVEHDIAELIRRKENILRRVREQPGVNAAEYESVRKLCRSPDHVIEMNGSVVGLALSPDHRYLYVNSHRWPDDVGVPSPINAPVISANLDLHIFDLATLTQVGALLHGQSEFRSNDDSYYVFPSVSHHYVVSGGTPCASLWDRHYGVRIAELPHADAVSCAAVNPCNPEMAVTVSDDKTVKVWRSRRAVKEHRIVRGIEGNILLPCRHLPEISKNL